jgi:hypothetical protein
VREGSRVLVAGAPDGFRLQPIPSGVEHVARVRAPGSIDDEFQASSCTG